MPMYTHRHSREAQALVQVSHQHVVGLLNQSEQYADQLMKNIEGHGFRPASSSGHHHHHHHHPGHHHHHSHAHHSQHVENRKRKRASPWHDASFSEHIAQPSTPTQDLLPLLRGELRHHQLVGVKWLIGLYSGGLNGVLSDELDCDRKAQVIGMLAYLQSRGVWGPFLMVGPASCLPGWAAELHRLLPAVHVHVHDGSAASRDVLSHVIGGQDVLRPTSLVVLVTHDVLAHEAKALARHNFRYLVVDASQCGRKALSHKLLSQLQGLPVPNMVLLTACHPAQGACLTALWPLLQLLLPDVAEAVRAAVQRLQDCLDPGPSSASPTRFQILQDVARRVSCLVDRFVLCRSAEDVDLEAPRRTVQANLYDYFASD